MKQMMSVTAEELDFLTQLRDIGDGTISNEMMAEALAAAGKVKPIPVVHYHLAPGQTMTEFMEQNFGILQSQEDDMGDEPCEQVLIEFD